MNSDIEDLLDFKSIYISEGNNVITGELKKIDSLWDIFAAGGLTNPLDVIELITYIMSIHDLVSKADVPVVIHMSIFLLRLFPQAETDSSAHLVISLR